jgi:cytochrome c-type biogenesis protein CcmF
MIPEFGILFLIIALLFSVALAVVPTVGMYNKNKVYIQSVAFYLYGYVSFIFLAYGCLTLCFLQNDFTVSYVLNNSSLSLPWFYKLCAVWGGHEGSILLWVVILSMWMLAVTKFSNNLPLRFRCKVLVTLGAISFGFLLFILTTSNPFARQFAVIDTEGRDLNPLLQDPGFLFHPPMLYMGYVGFSVAFAFAIAALWEGSLEKAWSRWTRPWTLAAWCFLTAGITLGSWWAYRELGWGGWWFWDPVENASFMPWLVGTALVHSLAVSEQREQFKAWTLLLSIAAFSLSLIGTFLVRSGVLTSVHAFAVDPQRGLYILLFLAVVIGGSLILFALRVNQVKNSRQPGVVSRESGLLLNNVFLITAMLTVLLGTVYPLLIDGLGLGKLSVGAPYFNSVFVPLMLPLFFLMGLVVHLRWGADSLRRIKSLLVSMTLLTLMVTGIFFYAFPILTDAFFYLGVFLAFWIFISTFSLLLMRVRRRGLSTLSASFLGMLFAHLGVGVAILGVAVSSHYGEVQDIVLKPGEATSIQGYQVRFQGEEALSGPNYHGTRARFLLDNHGKEKYIYPEKRIYNVAQMAMTDAAIDVNPFRDIYIALGDPIDQNAWSVRIYYKPLVRWIWGGGFMILLGGLIALSDQRYRYPQNKMTVTAEVCSE